MAIPKLPIIFIVVGSAICLFALFFGLKLFPAKYEAKIWEQFKLENGTDKWEKWRVTPIPVYQNIYLFHVTNPSEVLKGAKPILQEVGPYVFRQEREKVDINVDDEKDTISYKHFDVYHFTPEKSKGELTDYVTVPNLPFIGAVAKASKMPTTRRYFVVETLSNYPSESLYVNVTVDEFLFGGYLVPFMKDLSELSGEVLLPNNTFGLYYGKNASKSLEYEVFSGKKDPTRFGQVVSFGNQTEMTWGYSPECNRILGSDGVSTSPFMKPDRVFYMFVPGLCRSLRFEYETDVNYLGIPGYRFTVPREFFGDPRTRSENRCYCSGYPTPMSSRTLVKEEVKEVEEEEDLDDMFGSSDEDGGWGFDDSDEKEEIEEVTTTRLVEGKAAVENLEYLQTCPKEGVWELSACRKGTPLVMSYPHFYLGSEEYLNQSEGLSPLKEKHQLHVELEPNAVIPLQVRIRVQMNIAIEKSKIFKQMKTVPDMVHPIFWMDQGVSLDGPMAQMVKDKLIRTKELAILAAYCIFGFGCICIITGIMIFICRASSAKRNTEYDVRKHSVKRNSSYGNIANGDMIMESPSKPQKFATIAQSPPTLYRQNTEEAKPFLPPRNEGMMESNMSNGHNGRPTPPPPVITRTSTPPTPVPTPTPPPRIVTLYPKVSDLQPINSPYQKTYPSDEVDGEDPERAYSPKRSANALGEPFPSTKEFSSTNSVDNALTDMDNTLKGIQDTLSSYENL